MCAARDGDGMYALHAPFHIVQLFFFFFLKKIHHVLVDHEYPRLVYLSLSTRNRVFCVN